MAAALYDPEFGYYNRRDLQRWGREADYRTSSERSELFAATFARYFAACWDELGQPAKWMIVEGGAGDARFAQRVLRTLAERQPRVFAATRYCLHEISDDSLSRARERLVEFGDRVSYAWRECFETGIYFSNELLDAFPVHRVVNEGELYVGLDSDDEFTWITGPFSTPLLADHAARQTLEVNLGIDDWFASVAAKMKSGYVITVDYGSEGPVESTLRAFSKHGFVDDVLSAPGEYDITSSVDWMRVKRAGERLGFEVVEFASQDKFLLQAGLLEELGRRLERIENDADKLALTTDAREMILPGGMASSFQVLVQRRK